MILSLLAGWIFFQSLDSNFLSARNLSNLVLQIAVVGTIATGVVLVLLLGEIDLSVGSVAGVCSAVFGSLLVLHGWPWWGAIIAMLACGAAIGAFQGAWFAIIGVPSFVVTLAGNLGWLGVQLRVLGANGTINVFDENIAKIATSFLAPFWGWALAIAARRRSPRHGWSARPAGAVPACRPPASQSSWWRRWVSPRSRSRPWPCSTARMVSRPPG